ncbi:TonB-dependent receptor [Pseudothauera rhizosphaerae]|uniref:TonB-dependent receptor n=1 Tax=Pseudothauera rhizosphaerae TaxID=2565932 RepID=A0A4S4AMA6_9RHOO|nr:TonB-dependent receptor [Pseudothauera rhizosphaerae]THF60182.1 TonB-dependent receptor [Pseudothauera rhizosphaerae]
MQNLRPPRAAPLALACLLALAPAAPLLAAEPAGAQTAQRPQRFDIPPGPLAGALNRLAATAGLSLSFDPALVGGRHSAGLQGSFTAGAALARLLEGSGLTWRERSPGAISIERQLVAQDGVVTGTLNVGGLRGDEGGAERDRRGYDDVYDLDVSTSYLGKTEVERYKGATPSDLLTGVPGVFSGDARNSGALDVNIRGIQGPGRVPVTIDGTEQALTVWRGYNGASNRNYIDPNLIGGIQILKGPSLTRNTYTGIGGAMVVNTLDVDDVLDPGQTFGGEIKLEGSSNSVDPRLPRLRTGEDYRTVEGFPQGTPNFPYNDRTLTVQPKRGGGGYNVFDGGDHAYRLAFGWRPAEQLDLMAAYAYRERGNYYAGKRNAGYYSRERTSSADDYITNMARYWLPGNEVPNTSSQMESWLFKATWRPSPDQAVQFGYRDSLTYNGEIMPSRIIEADDRGAVQWPLSRVDAKAYNLEYKWQPAGSRWVDLYANLWHTDTRSDTYTAGGFPNFAFGPAAPYLFNTALRGQDSGRSGVTLSNKMAVLDSLDLTLGGSYQYEKLRSDRDPSGRMDPNLPSWNGMWSYPRAGRRQEWEGSFNLDWRPAGFLSFSAGARYASYWAFDDFLKEHEGQIRSVVTTGYDDFSYWTEAPRSQSDIDADIATYRLLGQLGFYTPEMVEMLIASVSRTVSTTHDLPGTWLPDGNGNYTKASYPCLNGTLDGVANVVHCSGNPIRRTETDKAKTRRDRGWVPFFAATLNFSDYSRAYLRYGETLRFPSLFESTMAFSSSLNPWGVKPEHAYNWEAAYVHDLSPLFGPGTVADVKLAYYDNKTRDAIERDGSFNFNNVDEHRIRGIELSGRYDNGRFFTDLGINYNLENTVCDEDTAAKLSTTNGYVPGSGRLVPDCVDYGFPGGYLLTQSAPDLSATWALGGRFLERRLEIGGRATYYREYRNDDLEWFRRNSYQDCIGQQANCGGRFVYTFNVPFSWGNTLLFDAYVRYRLDKNLALELTGTNLTDRYYVDPATRSAVAAPGRSIKLSLTGRF